jgi:nucleoside-diphosphate-sugar epimerase
MWRPLRPTPPPSKQWIDFAPGTPLAEGIARFVDWYRHYYQV